MARWKRIVDYLLVVIELFSLALTADALLSEIWRCLRDHIRLAILLQCRLVTEGQTDGHTMTAYACASTASRRLIKITFWYKHYAFKQY